MCSGAAYWAQIKGIVYGAIDEKRGSSKHGIKLTHPKTIVKQGVLEKECRQIMQSFFSSKRS